MLEPELSEAGDLDFVMDAVARLVVDGMGAVRQRAAFRSCGLPELRRLLSTTISPRYIAAPI